MKIKVEVEVDWIEEDGSIDEQIKEELINGVKQAISQSCIASMQKEASKVIEQSLQDAAKEVQAKAIQYFDDWLTKEMGMTKKECHIGYMSKEEAIKVFNICKGEINIT